MTGVKAGAVKTLVELIYRGISPLKEEVLLSSLYCIVLLSSLAKNTFVCYSTSEWLFVKDVNCFGMTTHRSPSRM